MTRSLFERLKPLNEKLQLFISKDDPFIQRNQGPNTTFHLLPPKGRYKGIVDGFFPFAPHEDPKRTETYVLWLDQGHGKYGHWKKYVKIERGSFIFDFSKGFKVEGRISDSGVINDFEYYFVSITQLVHPRLDYVLRRELQG
jgi:hypothetical protein